MALTIEFELRSTLPPLSWCARAGLRAPVRIRHGADVEIRSEGFVEGAWNGDFDAFDFDQAEALAGTGARLRGGRLIFCAPFHPLERLFMIRNSDEVLISNSLVFLLTEARETLDLSHRNYFFDFVAQVRNGIGPPAVRLRTASGRHVELFPCCNLELSADLSVRRTPKPIGPAPSCYADYFHLLLQTARDLAANAASRSRKKTYRLVAACSRGYDSVATAALASLAGCREGVTYCRSARVIAGHPLFGCTKVLDDDDGTESLRALGMGVTGYDRADLARLPGHPRAQFYISPVAITDAATSLMKEALRESVFVSGRHGERYWGPTRRCTRKDMREVDDCLLSGHALGEFRLHTGFVHFPPIYVGALHAPAIFRITQSPEMRPWLLGTGYYDRPIARRMAEEAGVPRECFGQKKLGAGLSWKLSDESAKDFGDFVQANVPAHIRRRLDPRPLDERLARHRRLAYFRTQYSHWPLVSKTMDLLHSDREHMLWDSVYLYQFHWGFDKIRNRYQ
jgi:hypothetical protein